MANDPMNAIRHYKLQFVQWTLNFWISQPKRFTECGIHQVIFLPLLKLVESVAFITPRWEQKIIYKTSFFHSYDKHFYSVWKRTGLQVVPVLEMIHDSHQSRFQKALSPKCLILTSAATMLDTQGSSLLFET